MVKRRVVVAMSGGVDSSFTAHLLLERGYEVFGAAMKVWNRGDSGSSSQWCGLDHIEDARKVAQHLGIKFYVIDVVKEFEKLVINYFCQEYYQGRTPNPCIICNQKVKFGILWSKFKGFGADYIATGHYAKIEYSAEGKRYLLKRGRSVKKEQSYFLFSLSQDQLASALFPLGDYTKEEVYREVDRLGLPVCGKRESQEVCFIPGGDCGDFIRARSLKAIQPGVIINTRGEVLGKHSGIPFFTVGQRKGLKICAGKPLYIVAINRAENKVIVGSENDLYQSELTATGVNWIACEGIDTPRRVIAKIRYNHEGSEAMVYPHSEGKVRVEFFKPQRAIAPGQAIVFYESDVVLGGGWIEKTGRSEGEMN